MAYPIVILGSGRGSNAEALLKAQKARKLGKTDIAAIISDVEDSGILKLGQKFAVPAIYQPPGHDEIATLPESGRNLY